METQAGPLSFKQGREVEHALGSGIEPSRIGTPLAQSWIDSATTPIAVAEMLPLGPEETLRRLRGEQLKQVLPFLGQPANLDLLFEQQIARFMAVKAWKEAKVGEGKYKDELWAAVRSFQYREDLAAIGLIELMIEDGRLPDRFLAEVTETYCYTDLARARNFEGIATPSGVLVIQAQWGGKYRNRKPLWCRENFHLLEQGGTIKEGLTGYLLFGKAWLATCYKDLPGSVSGRGNVPSLSAGAASGLSSATTRMTMPVRAVALFPAGSDGLLGVWSLDPFGFLADGPNETNRGRCLYRSPS